MLKNKLFLLSLILGISGVCGVNAQLTLQDMTVPKPPAYRVGISSIPENQYVQAPEDNSKIEEITTRIDDSNEDSVDVTYADLSIKRLSKEISRELTFEEKDMVADLSLLWQGAATQSDTINFALYKLANPDADKPDKQSLKKVLSTIASMSTIVGASMASPVLAGSSLIGGNILGIMSQDTKALNYKYSKVTDADMIILIRKVEDLQQNAVDLYYDYMSARKQVEMISKLVDERQQKFKLAQSNNAARELIVITDAYYRSALDKQRSARSNFLSKRAALEQFVGNEAFTQFEQDLINREKQENSSSDASSQTQEDLAYNETIQNVSNYTNNIQLREADHSVMGYNEYPTHDNYNTDPNLKMLPDIQPLNTPQSTAQIEEVAENIKEEAVEKEIIEPVKEKTSKKKEKVDKYSTKGMIFLHGMSKEQAKYAGQNVQSTDTSIPASVQLNPQQQITKDFNLLPLDEIAPPRNGRSIYEELPY